MKIRDLHESLSPGDIDRVIVAFGRLPRSLAFHDRLRRALRQLSFSADEETMRSVNMEMSRRSAEKRRWGKKTPSQPQAWLLN